MRVAEVMHSDVQACHPYDPLSVPAGVMWENGDHCVPVVDDEGHPMGIITHRDIAMAAYNEEQLLSEIPVSSAMSKQVHTCSVDDDVLAAHQVMREHHIHQMPVIDKDHRMAGILTWEAVAEHVHPSNTPLPHPPSARLD